MFFCLLAIITTDVGLIGSLCNVVFKFVLEADETEISLDRAASAHISAISLASTAVSVTSLDSKKDGKEKSEQTVGAKIIEAEENSKGAVSWKSYIHYFQAAGGVVFCIIVLLTFSLPVACSAFANFWLSYWLNQGNGVSTWIEPVQTYLIQIVLYITLIFLMLDVILVFVAFQNVTVLDNSTVEEGKISDNPYLYFYTGIYAATAVAVVVTTLARGFLFMNVSLA